jgi:hypothetical protein
MNSRDALALYIPVGIPVSRSGWAWLVANVRYERLVLVAHCGLDFCVEAA